MPHIIPVFISYAGCPHRCAFCNQHRISGHREFSIEDARGQIDRYLAFLPAQTAKELAFYGGSFTALPETAQESLLELAEEYQQKGEVTSLRISTRPDYIDETTITRLKNHGVKMVELGVQSLDDQVLALADRGHTSADVARAAAKLTQNSVAFGIQLMLGLPGQDWESVRETADLTVKMKPAVVRIYPVLIFADTKLADEFHAGRFQPLDIDTAAEQAAYLAEAFENAGIKVIRLGLQDDEGLREQGAILGGPYHPAFGELVAGQRYRKWLSTKLAVLPATVRRVRILLPARELSKVYGHKKTNLEYFKQHYPQYELDFCVADVEKPLFEVIR